MGFILYFILIASYFIDEISLVFTVCLFVCLTCIAFCASSGHFVLSVLVPVDSRSVFLPVGVTACALILWKTIAQEPSGAHAREGPGLMLVLPEAGNG